MSQLREIVSMLAPEQRARVLADGETFRRFVEEEAGLRHVLAAARAEILDGDPQLRTLMGRAADSVLAERYLGAVQARRLGDGFPDDDQVRRYYESNAQQFTRAPRVPVWQVFLALPEDATAARIAEIESTARRIADDLRAGRLDLAAAAARHSAHEASRSAGGFMGLLEIRELLPALRDAVVALPEGEVSEPLRGPAGFHVLRRGAIVDAQPVPLESVREQIRASLRQAAVQQLRRQLVAELMARGPGVPPDSEVEAWRQELSRALAVPVAQTGQGQAGPR